jgi:4-hydroxyacetophenone monooxygenase
LQEDGNGWYDMLSRDNVELVTDPIETFNESGIATKDGKDREHDVIILANGFKVSSYFFPTEYVGPCSIFAKQLIWTLTALPAL